MVDSAAPEPPDPFAASSLADLVSLLEQLRVWAGLPGRPVGFSRLEEMARSAVGVGALPRSTTHRVLSGRQDLAFVREPERFVADLVTTLGADPGPWLAALRRHLPDAEPEEPARPTAGRRPRRALVLAAVVVLVVAGLVTWRLLARDLAAPAVRVDYSRPVVFESGDSGLRLAIPQNSGAPGAPAAIVNSATATWDFAAPHQENRDFYQLRPTGSLLMCLEVNAESYADSAPIGIWNCNGRQHQYWTLVPGQAGMVLVSNLNSGMCLSLASRRTDAGGRLVQRVCDPQQQGQQWRVTSADRASSSATQAPAEYPGGGKDQPCEGISPALDATTQHWTSPPKPVQKEDAARGRVTLDPEGGAVELMRADRTGAEAFFWAEGSVNFTPAQFGMALQWTLGAGWHTCQLRFATTYDHLRTVALPRAVATGQVSFRICMSYLPEYPPVTNCTEAY